MVNVISRIKEKIIIWIIKQKTECTIPIEEQAENKKSKKKNSLKFIYLENRSRTNERYK